MLQFKLATYVKVQTIIAVSLNLGELINGYGVAWSAPILPKLQDLAQSPLPHPLTESQQSWVASTLYIGGVGALITGYLANKLGRRKTLISGGVLNLISYVVLTSAKNLAMVYIGRVLVGSAIALSSVAGLIYIGEIASPNIRGIILTSMGLFHAIGSLLVYSVGPFVSYTSVGYVVIGIDAVYIVACWFLPESPMFYVIQDNEEAVKSSLLYLGRDSDVSSVKAMMERYREQQQEKHLWRELFTVKINQYSLFVTVSLAFFQQCSGIISVLFFATTIFKDAGSTVRPEIATIIIGAAFVVGTCVSPIFIERCGRRVLLLVSTAGCSVFMTLLGVYFYLKIIDYPNLESLGWMPLTSLVAAIFMYSVGLTIIPNTLIGELFTSKARGLGSSCALICGWVSGLISTTVFGYIVLALGGHVTFWLYALIDAAAFVFVFVFVPETKGKSLMEIQMMLANWSRKG